MIPAIAAGCAAGIVDTVLALSMLYGVVCADVQASAAVFTEGFDKSHLRLSRKAFGIRAPLAGQRTTLEEDYGSNPGPIMNGKALNVSNNCARRGSDLHP